jgi:hypothetical protein
LKRVFADLEWFVSCRGNQIGFGQALTSPKKCPLSIPNQRSTTWIPLAMADIHGLLKIIFCSFVLRVAKGEFRQAIWLNRIGRRRTKEQETARGLASMQRLVKCAEVSQLSSRT